MSSRQSVNVIGPPAVPTALNCPPSTHNPTHCGNFTTVPATIVSTPPAFTVILLLTYSEYAGFNCHVTAAVMSPPSKYTSSPLPAKLDVSSVNEALIPTFTPYRLLF